MTSKWGAQAFKKALLVGLITAVCAEIKFSILLDNFRISPAVIVFPFLLVTLALNASAPLISLITMSVVFVFRVLLSLGPGTALYEAVRVVFPGAFFYLTYGLSFALIIRNRRIISETKVAVAACLCDFTSNLLELGFRSVLDHSSGVTPDSVLKIAAIAAVRAVLLYTLLLVKKQYHFLLKREEHEQRYRQLFLLTADLKSELYLMKKNSEQIESVMKEAYLLYERLRDEKEKTPKMSEPQHGDGQCAPPVQDVCLNIAREVHDIKKDYYRLIQGIEEELGKNPDASAMELKELLQIMTEAAHMEIRRRQMDASVETEIQYSFKTDQHYSLMSILMNLVTNSIEAMDGQSRAGRIIVREYPEEENVCFVVEDNGKGIPERRLQRIFDMGYSSKFDQVTGNIYRGMGLPRVKQLVEDQFHGTIEVSSREGQGTLFTVRLPKSEIIGEKS